MMKMMEILMKCIIHYSIILKKKKKKKKILNKKNKENLNKIFFY